MNTSLFNVYSEVYSTALMQDTRSAKNVAVANKLGTSRFGALVKLLRRG